MPLDNDAIDSLKTSISAARKKEMNFALCMGKKAEGTVLMIDRIKDPGVLYKQAKRAGETAKMASGTIKVDGSKAMLNCMDEPPAGCGRKLKQFFAKTVGMKLKVIIQDSEGNVLEGDDEDGDENQAGSESGSQENAAKEEWQKVFDDLDPQVQSFIQAGKGDVARVKKVWDFACGKADPDEDYETAVKLAAKMPDILEESADAEDTGDEALAPAGGDGVAEAPEAPTPADGADDALKAELTKRMGELVPKVKELLASKAAGADKLGNALKAIGREISSGAYDKAKALLDTVEKAVAALAASAPNIDELRQKLKDEFAAFAGQLTEVKENAEKGVAGKAEQLEKMFESLINGEDMKKAASVVALAKKFAETEAAKLAQSTESIFDVLGDKISDVVEDVKDVVEDVVEEVKDRIEDVKETIEDVVETVDDAIDSLTENGRKKLELQDLGYSEEEQNKIVAELEKNPNAVKEAKEKKVDEANIPDKQKEVLKKLAESDHKAFAAAMNALETMEADGAIDASPAEIQKSQEELETARKAFEAKMAALTSAKSALDDLNNDKPAPDSEWGKALAASAAAEQAFKDFSDSMPDDPSTMTEEERNAAMAKANELDAARKAAAKKVEEEKAAALEAANKAVADAESEMEKAKGDKDKAQGELDDQESKRGLLDALTFGRLSPDAKPAFKSEDKASFIEAFTKDGKLARSAMDLAARSPDPSVVAQNVGNVADKMNDGFAAEDGRKLDMSDEDMREMANNALRMGALEGQEYFDGFSDYLKSGKQLEPDPHGGLDEPLDDPKAERQRKNKIALNRTSGLGAAALDENGKVDFDSPEAKGAMDHMMFHPGSLKTFTPQLNSKMSEVKGLFADETTGPKAQGIIDKTKLPADGAPGKLTAQKLVAGTMDKKADEVGDNDAKASVLSAMMTPLSQGPVGSCFSTAPVRAIRETDPLRAMDEYSKIANTGQFKANDGKTYPANLNPPKGENPLMRSWEYSVATAAGELVNGIERKKMSGAVLDPAALGGIKNIVPADKWADKTDPVTGLKESGIETKLRKAVAQQLKFEYNAGPPVGTPPSGGGDGSSTDGGYEIKYNGKALKSQADFVAAMKDIGLTASGYAEGTTEGDQIAALVAGQPFINSILNAYGPPPTPPATSRAAPWNLPGGGFEHQTDKVLDGGNPTIQGIIGKTSGTPPPTQTQRNVQLLGVFLGQQAPDSKDMEMLSTRGTNANHAFNGLPNHPSLDKIRDPNSAAKIQSELIDPGIAIATTKMPADKAARMFDDQVKAFAESAPSDERDLLIAALKKRPTTDMTPAELKAKVETELQAYRDAVAQKRADKYVAEDEPTADNARKAYILTFYKDQVKDEIKASVDSELVNSMQMPEVVVADSNWGGPEGQTLFVMAPDPSTGDLKMWKKDAFTGKLSPLGKNWEDSNWYKVD